MRSRTMIIGVMGIVIGALLSTAVVLAGGPDPGTGPTDPAHRCTRWSRSTSGWRRATTLPSRAGSRSQAVGPGRPRCTPWTDSWRRRSRGRWRSAWPRRDRLSAGHRRQLDPVCGHGPGWAIPGGHRPAVPAIFGTAYNTPAWTGVRFTDNGDGTVTDNLTALIWLKNANCFGAELGECLERLPTRWPAVLVVSATVPSPATGGCLTQTSCTA